MMTRAQIRARLREALGAPRPSRGKRGHNVVRTIDQSHLLRLVRDGEAIVISREVAELIVEQLWRPVYSVRRDGKEGPDITEDCDDAEPRCSGESVAGNGGCTSS